MRVHFVGIGGIGMSGIAQVLAGLGYQVSGSDLHPTSLTKKLEEQGIKVFAGHSAHHVDGAEMVVVSSAIPAANPEVLEANARKIPVVQRAEMLAFLMKSRFGIAVAGAHGKTTTTSMVASILEKAGKDPTVVIGGELTELGHNAKLGQSEILVAEADESDASFLKLSPKIVVLTNIDADVNPSLGPYIPFNFDYEKTREHVEHVFLEFLKKVPTDGFAVLCSDCVNIKKILNELSCSFLTYGLKEDAELNAREIKMEKNKSRFKVFLKGKPLGEIVLQVPGKHNVLNALGALGVAIKLGITFADAQAGLESFQGVKRRFQMIGEISDILVVDDYAHNPTKVKATLAAAKAAWGRRVVAVFQPHRYTRTKFLQTKFLDSFLDADLLILTEIYSAGENPLPEITGVHFADDVKKAHPEKEIYFVESQEKAVDKLLEISKTGDMVITLGAGDVYRIGQAFFSRLKSVPAS